MYPRKKYSLLKDSIKSAKKSRKWIFHKMIFNIAVASVLSDVPFKEFSKVKKS